MTPPIQVVSPPLTDLEYLKSRVVRKWDDDDDDVAFATGGWVAGCDDEGVAGGGLG